MKTPGSNPHNPYKGERPPPSPNPPDPPGYKRLSVMQPGVLNGRFKLSDLIAVLNEMIERQGDGTVAIKDELGLTRIDGIRILKEPSLPHTGIDRAWVVEFT